jgi:hypothetical protein
MSTFDANSSTEIFRKDWPQIIAMKRELAIIGSVRLKDKGSSYPAGTVLGKYSSGSYSGLWSDYSSGGASGLNTARAILLETVEDKTGTAASSPLARALFAGVVYEDKCSVLDSTAKTSLGGRSWSDGRNVNFFTF